MDDDLKERLRRLREPIKPQQQHNKEPNNNPNNTNEHNKDKYKEKDEEEDLWKRLKRLREPTNTSKSTQTSKNGSKDIDEDDLDARMKALRDGKNLNPFSLSSTSSLSSAFLLDKDVGMTQEEKVDKLISTMKDVHQLKLREEKGLKEDHEMQMRLRALRGQMESKDDVEGVEGKKEGCVHDDGLSDNLMTEKEEVDLILQQAIIANVLEEREGRGDEKEGRRKEEGDVVASVVRDVSDSSSSSSSSLSSSDSDDSYSI